MHVVSVPKRWFVVLGAVLIQLSLGAIYAWSVFTPALQEAGWSKLDTQAVFAVGLATFAVVMVFAGRLLATFGPRALAIALAVVALNLLDAWFTLLFLSHGGTELNPIVQQVLESDWHPWPFVLMKTLGIGLACAFLIMAKYFRPARYGLWFVFVGYSVLLCWHLYLYSQLEALRVG